MPIDFNNLAADTLDGVDHAAEPFAERKVIEAALRAVAAEVKRETAIEACAYVRQCKYYDRGEGLEDEDPHSDDHPDYEREWLDEEMENTVSYLKRHFQLINADFPPKGERE